MTFRRNLETEALLPIFDDEPGRHVESEIQASIAISLKRIADMLDGTTLGLNAAETIFNPQTVQNRQVQNHY